jgi:serine/threonine-protein kinase
MNTLQSPFDPQFFALQKALAGRYSLETELGRGGMGVVYLAQDVQLDRPVALKVLPQEVAGCEEVRDRFLREARTAAKLSHPNIVPIFAVEEAGEFVYYVMAYVAGETLGQRVQTRGPLAPSESARVLKEVGWALAYAHSQGVVHRDIKPDNILLEEGSGRALVADFGIAGLLEVTGATGVGEIIGTAEFMSPEQASGQGVDERSDIYSMGVVAFYTVSGTLPFHDVSAAEVLRRHREEPSPPVKTVAPHVPSRMARCIDRCLAKDAAARFDVASAFSEAIDDAMRGQRDVPVAVRNFITDPIDLPGDGPVYLSAAGVVQFFVLLFAASNDPRGWPLFWGLTAALSAPILLVIQRIRRLLAAGHTQADLEAALRAEAQRRREELAHAYGAEAGLPERVATQSVKVAGVTVVVSFVGLFAAMFGYEPSALHAGILVGSGLATAVAIGVRGALRGRRVDQKAERRLWFWKSKVAKWLFKLSGVFLKKKAFPIRPTHRPTELQIGFAVDALYEQLPKTVRADFGDVPLVVRQLESDAQGLRQTLEMLNDAHAAARAAGGDVPPDLKEAREETERHLAEAVASLETIRLGLLRLTTGAGTAERFTTDLSAAAEVGDRIDRLMDGMGDVELLLRST